LSNPTGVGAGHSSKLAGSDVAPREPLVEELRVVEQVEEFRAKFCREPLIDARDLVKRKVPIIQPWPVKKAAGGSPRYPDGKATSKTQVIEPGLLGAQTGFEVAEAGAISQLRESQTEELSPAREIFHVTIALVAIHAELKLVGGDELHEQRENGPARVQGLPPR